MITRHKTNLTLVVCPFFETILANIMETNGFCVKAKTDSERAT